MSFAINSYLILLIGACKFNVRSAIEIIGTKHVPNPNERNNGDGCQIVNYWYLPSKQIGDGCQGLQIKMNRR